MHRSGFRAVTQRTHWDCGNLGYEWRQRRLIGRTVTGGTGAGTQHYVFDGKNMVLAFDGNDNLTDRYLWGPAVDQVLADENYSGPTSANPTSIGNNTLWALGDNQNSVRDVVTDSGTLEQHIAYSPFGQQVSGLTTTGSVVANFAFGYTGTYTDPVTGFQLHGVRWYDPVSQRWLTQDPAAADENLYRYCGNGPTDGIDPSGMADEKSNNSLSNFLDKLNSIIAFPSKGIALALREAVNSAILARIRANNGRCDDAIFRDLKVTVPVGTVVGLPLTVAVNVTGVHVTRKCVSKDRHDGVLYSGKWGLDTSVSINNLVSELLGAVQSLKGVLNTLKDLPKGVATAVVSGLADLNPFTSPPPQPIFPPITPEDEKAQLTGKTVLDFLSFGQTLASITFDFQNADNKPRWNAAERQK